MMQNLQNPKDLNVKADSEKEGHVKEAKETGTNEKVIHKVLEAEKHADKVYEKAVHEAEQLPVHADQEAQTLIEKSRAAAKEEANRLVDQAKVQEQSVDIMTEAEKNIQHTETLASSNYNRAVSYVVARVIGRE